MNKRRVVLLMGLPGSGKGTQGRVLGGVLDLPHISTGDLFREMMRMNIDESKILNKFMMSGKLVPAKLVNEIVKQVLLSKSYKNGYILDGYPRNLEQVEYFDKNVDSGVNTVFFDVSDRIVLERIKGRYSCQSCGAIYNSSFAMSKVTGVCDYCGSKNVISRSDDVDEKTILARINEYKKETLPVVEYYKNKENFFLVNADNSREKVSEEVSKIAEKI